MISEGSGITMKHVASILALQLCMTTFVFGQMPRMADHPSQPADDSNASSPAANGSTVTFTKDVAPIVQQNCQSCHRPGEGTPFSLLTYEDARPWAKLMRQMVQQRQMPPWFEDGHTEKFANNRSLTQAEIDNHRSLGERGCAEGRPEGPSSGAAIRARMVYSQAGPHIPAAQAVFCSG